MPEISVILPTYNERENIGDLINELILYLSKYISNDFEFLVVDDDSPDKTWEEVEKYFGREPRVRLIRRFQRRSLASAIYKGIEESKGNIICWLDCDFSMPPYKLVELVKKVSEGYDVAVGSRFIKGGKDVRGATDSWLAAILSQITNYFISLLLGSSFKDYTSGFAAARKEIFKAIQIKGDYGEYFIDFIYNARNRGYKIIEVPYYCLPRRRGSSKTNNNWIDYLKNGWKYILLTLRLKLK